MHIKKISVRNYVLKIYLSISDVDYTTVSFFSYCEYIFTHLHRNIMAKRALSRASDDLPPLEIARLPVFVPVWKIKPAERFLWKDGRITCSGDLSVPVGPTIFR